MLFSPHRAQNLVKMQGKQQEARERVSFTLLCSYPPSVIKPKFMNLMHSEVKQSQTL